MNVLYIIPYSPANPTFGGSLRIYHILNHLCQHHDVTVAGFSRPHEEKLLIETFPNLTGKTHLIPPPFSDHSRNLTLFKSLFTSHSHWHQITRSEALQNKLDQLCESQSFDVIQCEFPPMAIYRFNSSAIKILDCHNVEYDNFKRMAKVKNPLRKLFYHIESYKFFREEIDICKQQDALFATSERDIDIFDTDVPNVPKYLVPNGVDANYFYPSKVTPKAHSLIFVGMMKYVPNYDGINYFLDEIFPKILESYPKTTITIIGKNPPKSISKRASKNIIVTGFVEDTRPYIQEAAVYVVPLRMGGGTRLKVIEALAMKKPLVTTSIGCEGIDIISGENALVADSPEEFAEAVIELFNNNELSNKITENGYELMMKKYRWESIGEHINHAYEELTGIPTNSDAEEIEKWGYETNGIYK